MIGLCLLMAPQPLGSKNDVDHYFESAVNSYIHKAKSPFFGTRATLLCYELCKQRNLYKDAPNALTRMTGEVTRSEHCNTAPVNVNRGSKPDFFSFSVI